MPSLSSALAAMRDSTGGSMPSPSGSSASRRPAPAARRRSTASPGRAPVPRARRGRGGRAGRSSPARRARDRLPQLDLPGARQAAQLLFVRELVRRARAVEAARCSRCGIVQRMPQHRAQRRDAGAAGDEDETALLGIGGEGERAERPFDVDERARIGASGAARACRPRRRRPAAPDTLRAAHPLARTRSSTAAASRGRGWRSRSPVRARSRTG